MIMYRVTVYEGTNPCTVSSKGDILSLIEDPQAGDKVTIEIIDMSMEDFENLPEWDGP
jgi:hypothetical protein